jgi:uncharacterized protein YndB with AHSA1/START domain
VGERQRHTTGEATASATQNLGSIELDPQTGTPVLDSSGQIKRVMGLADAPQASTMPSTLEACMYVNRSAPAYAEHEICIESSPERVWALISDIEGWSSWQPDFGESHLDGALAPGSTFRWKSGGRGVSSTIQQVEPPSRLAWTGSAAGAKAKHVWIVEPKGSGVVVRTEESFEGLVVVILKRSMQRLLDSSLQKRLEALKRAAESTSGQRGA